jgi:hypothetical protein
MSNPYFRQVPNFEYISRNNKEQNISDYVEVKNLFKRGRLREDIFGDLTFFEKYKIIGNERPDDVANKFYNDPTLDWVILLANNILNIQSEWPLAQQAFDRNMLRKYEDYDTLYNGIHHYETKEIKNSKGITVLKEGLRISNTWRTNGNFIEINNTKISQIFSGNGIVPSKTVRVTVNNGIYGLNVGSQIRIFNVSEKVYNGTFVVTSALIPFGDGRAVSFTYELTTTPLVATPTLSTPRKEEVLLTLESSTGTGSSYYYEYWDEGLGYSVIVPSTSFVAGVTNFEYENNIEENKRNIYVLKPEYLNVIFNDMDNIMPYKEGGEQYLNPTLKRGNNIRLYN